MKISTELTPTDEGAYRIQIDTGETRVYLRLAAERTYEVALTPTEARRVAAALLLGAEEMDAARRA